MKNKITFYNFNGAKKAYDENLLARRRTIIIQKKNELNKKNEKLNNLLINYRKLNKSEAEALDAYNKNLKKIFDANFNIFSDYQRARKNGAFAHLKPTFDLQFPPIEKIQHHIELLVQSNNPKDINESLNDIKIIKYTDEFMLSSSDKDERTKLQKSFFSKLLKGLSKEHDLSKIIELKKHEPYSPKIKVLEKEIEENKNYISEFENQERIESKDLENLNNEISEMNQKGWKLKQIEGIQSGEHNSYNDGGYGYSFTKGILIVWEKND